MTNGPDTGQSDRSADGTAQTILTHVDDSPENPETLRRAYWDDGMSIDEIADLYGTSKSVIYRRFEKFGIDRKEPGHHLDRDGVPFRTNKEGYERWRDQFRSDCGRKRERSASVHRLFAVSIFGFEALKHDVVVHHLNGIPWDNREANLSLMSRVGHSTHHQFGGDRGGE